MHQNLYMSLKRIITSGLLIFASVCTGCSNSTTAVQTEAIEPTQASAAIIAESSGDRPEYSKAMSVPITAELNLRKTSDGVVATVTSSIPFEVRNAIYVLKIGSKQFNYDHHDRESNGRTLVFRTITDEEFDMLSDGDTVSITDSYGMGVGLDGFETLYKSQMEVE